MNSNSKYVDQLVFETASLELGIPIEQIRSAFNAQVQYTSRAIGEGNLETVMWPFFGKFQPKILKLYKKQRTAAETGIRKATKKPL